ncbi:hypothetical protein QAD02_003967 [Eretmocerus hayati]|uniref:Uncharacterized protein n=1 Tax=Eretmocerus hayati TaxID=131215 RepID=A0ACC2NNM7_9HYME|nr:hypothetical protein QAD02_003967 [Eretmocerus hayati]
MMTAMARLPCNNKQTSPAQKPRYAQPQPAPTIGAPTSSSFAQSRGYWEMQQQQALVQAQIQHQQQVGVGHPVQYPVHVRSNHHRGQQQQAELIGKRKSAVELLQESKAFYVKSETVLDRKQELKNSGHLQVSQLSSPSAPPRLLRKCQPAAPCSPQTNSPVSVLQQQQQQQQIQAVSSTQPACCWAGPSPLATCHQDNERPLPPKSPRLVPVPQRRSGSSSSGFGSSASPEQLQVKLRRLLNYSDSKENVFFPESSPVPAPPAEYASPPPIALTPGSSAGGREDRFRFSPGGSLSPGCRDDDRAWSGTNTGDGVRFKFGRSNSHSHGAPLPRLGRVRSSHGPHTSSTGHSTHRQYGSTGGDDGSNQIDGSYHQMVGVTGQCHKSLPDLHHSSSRRRASLSPRASSKARKHQSQQSQLMQQSQGCPDCETGSDYSERSFNRDSVCYRSGCSSRNVRRSLGSGGGGDASSVLSSGGRTQKSSGSSKLSHGATARDSGGSSGHCTHRSEPPPKIQDCWSHAQQRRDSGASTQHSTERDRSRGRSSSYNSGHGASCCSSGLSGGGPGSGIIAPPPPHQPPAIVRHYSPDSESSNSPTDYSPTCNSRFSDGWKEGRNRPILRSKSDISDRYWRHGDHHHHHQSMGNAPIPGSASSLESFFDRLGLEPDDYQHMTEPSSRASSPVFFNSVSSVDSALGLHWASQQQHQPQAQSTWQQSQQSCAAAAAAVGQDDVLPGQRSGDPPSIIERNARIIKWLCNCRKVQFGYS